MDKPKENLDCVGVPIRKGDLVCIQFTRPPVAVVVASETGGLHTPQGQTPARIRIVLDMNLAQIPGQPFTSLVRVVGPQSQTLIENIADHLSHD